MFEIKKTTLENGLKVLMVPMEQTKAVTIFAIVGVGSRYESKKINGLAHFAEHMFYKGTKKLKDGFEVMRALDNLGADFNAHTSDEETAFYISAQSEKISAAIEILHDILANSKFEAKEIEREKGVILEEIKMIYDNPMVYISEVAQTLFFGDTPLGWSTAGSKESVVGLKQTDFLTWHKSFYQPENMILVVAGALSNQEKILEQIKKLFGGLKPNENKKYESYQARQNGPKISLHTRQTDQTHLILGYRGISRIDKRRPILRVLNSILGGMTSSRLFVQVREKRGLAYYVRSDFWDFQDTGTVVAGVGLQTDRIEEAIKVILEQFQLLTKKSVSDEELQRAKTNLIGHLYLGLENSAAVAGFVAEKQLFWGEPKKIEKVIEEIKAVKASEIIALAKELFIKNHLNMAIIGPYKNSKKFEDILGG